MAVPDYPPPSPLQIRRSQFALDVRFKNQGLDSIEIQDNGSGIAPDNYAGLALKHHTSKLSTYADLGTLQTFGFRGEALSSLCALSQFTVVTCLPSDVPKGTKLEFETSGRLLGTSVVASQRGTTVSVENLFKNLPVRRRELERNIKREWGKVINLLNQYACVQTGVKFTVSQQPNKGKRMVLFSTKGNATTRENIVNVFGAKTMSALLPLDLKLELEPTSKPNATRTVEDNNGTTLVRVIGHVSRPAHGEGRQTPDRQMFYVNGRPCQLPQFAKVFNEVYRSYNSSQSPFIFADIQLDTHLYDVNVSPDKRSILLHDQGKMLDTLRESLVELFEKQDITVPVSAPPGKKTTPLGKYVLNRRDTSALGRREPPPDTTPSEDTSPPVNMVKSKAALSTDSEDDSSDDEDEPASRSISGVSSRVRSKEATGLTLISRWVERKATSPKEQGHDTVPGRGRLTLETTTASHPDVTESIDHSPTSPQREPADSLSRPVAAAGADIAQSEPSSAQVEAEADAGEEKSARSPVTTSPPAPRQSRREAEDDVRPVTEPPIPAIATPSRPSAPRANVPSLPRTPARRPHETAIITIGDQTTTSIIGSTAKRQRVDDSPGHAPEPPSRPTDEREGPLPSFRGRLTQMFAASGSGRRVGEGRLEELGSAERGSDTDQEDEMCGRQSADDEGDPDSEGEGPSAAFDIIESGRVDMEEEEEEEHQPDQDDEQEEEEFQSEESDEREDEPYIDEDGKKLAEELKVEEMIQAVEEATEQPTVEGEKRGQTFLKGAARKKDSTLQLAQRLQLDEASVKSQFFNWASNTAEARSRSEVDEVSNGLEADDAEEKLSLIISKSDFSQMQVIGQFNLGFILAVRRSPREEEDAGDRPGDDDLFIIDQHASDEKYNFERLQASTVVQSQRLVHPKQLELTAIEEEIILENRDALEANGFVVKVDESGETPVGARCRVVSLPLSRETTFSLADLEELISLLGDGAGATTVPRPSRVRKMFAMRACRSSIMIGKALSRRQMENVVRHMGEMEKPWNCPHGRPTMRHLCSLSGWGERGWNEGDDVEGPGDPTDWAAFLDG